MKNNMNTYTPTTVFSATTDAGRRFAQQLLHR